MDFGEVNLSDGKFVGRIVQIVFEELEISPVNFLDQIAEPELRDHFEKMHALEWNQPEMITPEFQLTKFQGSLAEYQPKVGFELIYFDAFAPSKHPELWTLPVFEKIFSWLVPSGVMVTYCAKGQVKRDLKTAGFTVESLPGPPGKREMTRATVPDNSNGQPT